MISDAGKLSSRSTSGMPLIAKLSMLGFPKEEPAVSILELMVLDGTVVFDDKFAELDGLEWRRWRESALRRVLKKLPEASFSPLNRKFSVGRQAATIARPDSMIDQKRKRVTVTVENLSYCPLRERRKLTAAVLCGIEASLEINQHIPPRPFAWETHKR